MGSLSRSLSRSATELLQQYAEYHRDRRNIATHFVGVPMIVFGVGALLARPEFMLGERAWTPGWIVLVLAVGWYVSRGLFTLGLVTSLAVGALVFAAHGLTQGLSTWAWLAWALGFFGLGWVIQFVGHWYEGRKPAFADDLVGLLVAPMFVTLEAFALLGAFRKVIADVERHAGPTVLRDLAHPAT
jgi:uncharacterized membrane protein YGL010W